MGEKPVVEQQEREHEYKIIEKRVVRGEDDGDLPRSDYKEQSDANFSGQKSGPDQHEFERERKIRARGMKPMRQMLDVPADPGGQRAVLVILVHRRKIPPFGIAAHDFGDARLEIDAEPFP